MGYYPPGHPHYEWHLLNRSVKEARKRLLQLIQRGTITPSVQSCMERDIERMETNMIPLRKQLEDLGIKDPTKN